MLQHLVSRYYIDGKGRFWREVCRLYELVLLTSRTTAVADRGQRPSTCVPVLTIPCYDTPSLYPATSTPFGTKFTISKNTFFIIIIFSWYPGPRARRRPLAARAHSTLTRAIDDTAY
eukprot:SAG31_NODE_4236_length_3427_cov_24.184574_6_plen_117_part_00